MAKLTRLVLLLLVLLSGCDNYDPDRTAAYLADLGITGYQLEPSFSSSTFDYVATIPPGTDSITVEVTSTHQGATVTVNGILVESDGGSITLQLAEGTNTIKVVVLSSDNMRTQTYTVLVTGQWLSYSVGGAVSGLTGALTLQNNAGDDLAIAADGVFEFATPVTDGDDYAVTVSVQPDGQFCSVTNAAGTIAGANVSDVSVNCVDDVAQTYTVGGSVGGLIGNMTLQNNGADDLIVNAIGSFSFATAMADGTAYAVTVSSQPAGQLCIVSNGAGTISGANVINVSVSCSAIVLPTYTVGGTISGLTGNVSLQNNGADDLPIAADGPFVFSTALNDGSTYA
ncbi:MAG: cadherin-like beta sandwich domain-containing protein, partial [Gammaproteobacteria bacterium]|nr:cadherin-like beta sandwich domain-containing protein [Gammaproteobacteria bacterium]